MCILVLRGMPLSYSLRIDVLFVGDFLSVDDFIFNENARLYWEARYVGEALAPAIINMINFMNLKKTYYMM